MLQGTLFQIDREILWEDLGNGVKRKLYGYDNKVMLVKVKFDAGAIGQLHEHHHSQVTYVESGAFEMTIGNQKKIIRAGDGYYVPPHEFMAAPVSNPEYLSTSLVLTGQISCKEMLVMNQF